jgi:predicted transposase YdaD
MFQISDLRHTRVYQEGLQAGEKIGFEKGLAIATMVAEKKPRKTLLPCWG